MNIKLYKTSSPYNKVTKTLTNEISLDGNLKDNTPITDIDILITTTTNLSLYNYCYISDFNRYYNIKVEIVRGGLWRVYGHVDVLMSFKTEILNNTAIVERQENNYNLYLSDNIFKVYNKTNVITKNFTNGFDRNGSYILTVIGG